MISRACFGYFSIKYTTLRMGKRPVLTSVSGLLDWKPSSFHFSDEFGISDSSGYTPFQYLARSFSNFRSFPSLVSKSALRTTSRASFSSFVSSTCFRNKQAQHQQSKNEADCAGSLLAGYTLEPPIKIPCFTKCRLSTLSLFDTLRPSTTTCKCLESN